MKQFHLLLSFLILLFFISSVSAISSDLKSSYTKGETAIGQISGVILESINNDNVELRRGHVLVPLEYELKKAGENYFIWFTSPLNENNYSLIIKDIVTIINGKTSSLDYVHNFTVVSNVSDYSINPGFISSSKDFEFKIFLNEDQEKSISIDIPSAREFILKPGQNTLKFSISEFNQTGLRKISIGKYIVPVYTIVSQENTSGEKPKLRVEPNSIVSTAYTLDNLTYPFQIINFGDKKIEDIIFEYNKELLSLSQEIKSLDSNSFLEINITIIKEIDEDIKKNGIKENILLKMKDENITLPIFISFTDNKTEANTPYLQNNSIYYCVELNGLVCSAGQTCSGQIRASVEGACCIGKCTLEEQASEGTGKWVGYLVWFLIILLFVYLIRRYKKTKATNEFNKVVNNAEKEFKKLP